MFIGLTTDRDKLYQRIDERVDKMIKQGLVKEVEGFQNPKRPLWLEFCE